VIQPVDSSILHEIVRIIESRRKVPVKVVVKAKEYLLTYLDDHQRRLEEALMRFDRDRLNMLYGQLASKIKYQLVRRLPARATPALTARKPAAKPAALSKSKAALKKPAAAKKKVSARSAKAAPRKSKAAVKAKRAAGRRA
jgi:hypothetical protein